MTDLQPTGLSFGRWLLLGFKFSHTTIVWAIEVQIDAIVSCCMVTKKQFYNNEYIADY